MPRSVAVCTAIIPSSFQRLRKHGYCAFIGMDEIWKLTVPAEQGKIDQKVEDGTGQKLPIVYISRVADNLGK